MCVCGKEKRRFENGKIAKHCHHCGGRVKAIKPCVECGGDVHPPTGSGRQASRCVDCTKRHRGAKAGNHKCPECNQTFYAARKTKYCGRKCREQAGRKSNWSTRMCEWCKKSFLAKTKTAKCCSQSCAGNKRNYAEKDGKLVKWERTCIGCGCVFRMKNGTRRKGLYCTRECAWKHGRLTAGQLQEKRNADKCKDLMLLQNSVSDGHQAWLGNWKKCNWCLKSFYNTGESDLCSLACRFNMRRGSTRECIECNEVMDRRECGKSRLCGRCKSDRVDSMKCKLKSQRRQKIKTATVERVVRRKVFEADRYHCWICLGLCKREYDSNDPASPTIDHVVPLAKGGKHSYANCRTAHAICNSLKGDM